MNRPFFYFLMLLFIISGCNNSRTERDVPLQEDTTVQAGTGEAIAVSLPDTFEIRKLNEAFDGGFIWDVASGFDTAIAQLIDYRTEYTGSSGEDGAPTQQIWRYRAARAGTDTLKLVLFRPWKPEQIRDSVQYILTVN